MGEALLPLHKAAFSESGTYDPLLKTNINSPGSFSLFSAKFSPLISAILLKLCAVFSAESLHSAAEHQMIKIGNSEDADDEYVIEVEAQVINQLKMLDLDDWATACREAKKAVEQTNLINPIRVEEDET